MSGLTSELIPNNIIAQMRSLERRVRVLETALAAARAELETKEFLVYDRDTGEAFQLYMETIDDVPVLWYESADEEA